MKTGLACLMCLLTTSWAAAQAPPSWTSDTSCAFTDSAPARVDNGLWVGAEYLLWWFKDAPTPPLVTAGPVSSNGILGQPGTVILFGGSGVDLREHQGARVTIGMMLDEDQLVGVEGNYFFLGRSGTSFTAASS